MRIEDQLQPGEEILYIAHVTRVTLAPLVLLLAVVLAVALYAWYGMNSVPLVLVSGAVALGVGAVLGWKFIVLRSNEFVLTSFRVMRQSGLLAKRSIDTRLDKINNIEYRQTLLGRVLNFGDIEIDTASESGISVFKDISHPVEFKRTILATAEQYRAGRAPSYAPAAAGPSGAERLRQLKALLDDGLVSPEEYEEKRRQLLAEL